MAIPASQRLPETHLVQQQLPFQKIKRKAPSSCAATKQAASSVFKGGAGPAASVSSNVSLSKKIPRRAIVQAAADEEINAAEFEEIGEPPYVLCNEQNQEETVQALKRKGIRKGNHFGFSAWFNYDIMAAVESSKGVICDVNPRMIEFYHIFEETIRASANRQEFVALLQIALNPEKKPGYFDNGFLFMLPEALDRSGSWLSTDEGFTHIKTMHEEGRVEYHELNAAEKQPSVFEQIKKELDTIQTFYASNIFEWLQNDSKEVHESFKRNMRVMIKPQTQYIDAFYPHMAHNGMPIKKGSGPPLRITEGGLPPFVRTIPK